MFEDQYLTRYPIYALGSSLYSLLLPRFVLSVIANALHLYALRCPWLGLRGEVTIPFR
jgi:hypothetical protein